MIAHVGGAPLEEIPPSVTGAGLLLNGAMGRCPSAPLIDRNSIGLWQT